MRHLRGFLHRQAAAGIPVAAADLGRPPAGSDSQELLQGTRVLQPANQVDRAWEDLHWDAAAAAWGILAAAAAGASSADQEASPAASASWGLQQMEEEGNPADAAAAEEEILAVADVGEGIPVAAAAAAGLQEEGEEAAVLPAWETAGQGALQGRERDGRWEGTVLTRAEHRGSQELQGRRGRRQGEGQMERDRGTCWP